MKAQVGFLLTADQFGEVVLSTALARLAPSSALLDCVAPAAESLLDRAAAGETAASGVRNARTPVELIGDHVVWLRVQNAISVDHPLLLKFFSAASVAARSSVLGHLGWLIMQADGISEDALQRASALWDSRADAVALGEASAEELSEFYWWPYGGKFDSAWWLPRLEQAANSESFDPHGMLSGVLEAAANQDPGRAIAILERLLSMHVRGAARYKLVQHAPGIIAAALDSSNSVAIAKAKKVMDFLGRSGHVQIAELVAQRRLPNDTGGSTS